MIGSSLSSMELLMFNAANSSLPSWVDKFLFWDLLCVTALVFTDFLIGKQGRLKIRDKVGWWWLTISESSYGLLLHNNAKSLLRFFQKHFGDRIISRKFFTKAITLSLLIYVSAILLLILLHLYDAVTSIYTQLDWFRLPYIIMVAEIVFFGTISYVLSLMVIIKLLQWMTLSVSFPKLIFIIILSFFLGYGSVLIGIGSISLIDTIFGADGFDWGYLLLMILASLFVLLPSLLLLILAAFFTISKLIRPILQKPTALIFQRLYESDKGVLTLVSVAIGAIAKLIQEFFKAF